MERTLLAANLKDCKTVIATATTLTFIPNPKVGKEAVTTKWTRLNSKYSVPLLLPALLELCMDAKKPFTFTSVATEVFIYNRDLALLHTYLSTFLGTYDILNLKQGIAITGLKQKIVFKDGVSALEKLLRGDDLSLIIDFEKEYGLKTLVKRLEELLDHEGENGKNAWKDLLKQESEPVKQDTYSKLKAIGVSYITKVKTLTRDIDFPWKQRSS